MNKLLKIIIAITLTYVAFSCKKYDDYSPIPELTFDSLRYTNDSYSGSEYLEITLDFIDGDGDLCISNDTVKNLFYTLYQMENDSMVEVELTVPYEFSIPYYEPEGRNKLMQGRIINKFYKSDLQNFDTIQFSFYAFDRAGNRSKTNYTPVIILKDYWQD